MHYMRRKYDRIRTTHGLVAIIDLQKSQSKFPNQNYPSSGIIYTRNFYCNKQFYQNFTKKVPKLLRVRVFTGTYPWILRVRVLLAFYGYLPVKKYPYPCGYGYLGPPQLTGTGINGYFTGIYGYPQPLWFRLSFAGDYFSGVFRWKLQLHGHQVVVS